MASSDTPPPAAVRHLTVDEESDGQRLDNYLVRVLKGVPKTHIYRIIRSGEVRRNKGRVAADDRVATGDVLRIPPLRVSAQIEQKAAHPAPAREFPGTKRRPPSASTSTAKTEKAPSAAVEMVRAVQAGGEAPSFSYQAILLSV